MSAWPEPVERVSGVLRAAAVDARIEQFDEGTPTARDAAKAIACELSQIVKTLVFVCDEAFVLALVPGDRRADERAVAAAAGAVVRPGGEGRRGRPGDGFRAGRRRAVPAARGIANAHRFIVFRTQRRLDRRRNPASHGLTAADRARPPVRGAHVRPRGRWVEFEPPAGQTKERARCRRPKRSG